MKADGNDDCREMDKEGPCSPKTDTKQRVVIHQDMREQKLRFTKGGDLKRDTLVWIRAVC